jgi:acetoin utilization deacetylase AcuC-like enzyme
VERSPIYSSWVRPEPRTATAEELRLRHTAEMIETLWAARGGTGWFDADTYYGPRSVDVALAAAGATLDLALAIWRGELRRGFSLVRPPGHHATASRPMGFCLINQISLAVAAIRNEKPGVRVAVVDFDLHHGNGTQDLFYQDPDVLVLSSHRYPFYPGSGAMGEIGAGRGRGTTVNFPLSERFGDDFFTTLYGQVALPIVEQFRPEMILVSAGFDGHQRDPMRGFSLSTAFYRDLSEQLIALAEKVCGGRILFCLEGGYNIQALADSVEQVLSRLGECPRGPFEPRRSPGGDFARLSELHAFYRPIFPFLG